jgi:hypothetical protein
MPGKGRFLNLKVTALKSKNRSENFRYSFDVHLVGKGNKILKNKSNLVNKPKHK